MSTDLHTLSGAYALHALSSEEAEEFQKHLDACPACRQEVKELQQAAAQMGASEAIRPPAHLKARVMAAADQMPQMPPRVSGSNVIEVPRGRWGARLLAAAAAVVVIVAGVVGIGVLQSEDEPSTRLASGVVEVFQAEDAHTATMDTANGGKISVATSPELGEMAVDTDELPPLDDEHDYQIWAIHNDMYAPVGVVEREKGAAMDMPDPDTVVAITIEPRGGSEQPTTEPIMQVEPAAV